MLLYSNINTYEFLYYIGVMVFNATFNNISVISWWSVLLVEKTRAPGENGSFPFIQLFEKQIVQVKNKTGINEIKGNQEKRTLN